MEKVTENAQELYQEYRYGQFSYGDKRLKFEPLLFEVLSRTKPDAALYDIGCGRGYWFDCYLRAGIRKDRITGVDLSAPNVEELQGKGFNAVVGNIMDLQIGDKVSDLTVCIGVINCADDPWKSFQELVRITKPGGTLYINVYNRLHPYYYIVHKGTFPIRWLYWNWSRKVADVVYWLTWPIFQPLSLLALGKFMDEKTAKIMFMDQVITPRAHLFTKSMLEEYARRCGCTVKGFRYNRYALMLSAEMVRNPEA